MRILYVSFDYGWRSSAEGLAGERLVCALAKSGAKVTVVTSDFASPGDQECPSGLKIIKVASWPRHPRGLFHAQRCWRWRVSRIPLMKSYDLVYGRAWPLGSLLAAQVLAERFKCPLLAHLSDPLPSPWASASEPFYKADLKRVRKILEFAKAVTFITPEAVRWQEETADIDLSAKSFILNHVAPAPRKISRPSDSLPTTFLYPGMLYGRRTCESVLRGFQIFLEQHPKASFVFVGPPSTRVLPWAKKLGIAHRVESHPRTQHLDAHLAASSVLVVIDAQEDRPVFLPLKLIDCCMLNRPILLVSPEGSPSWKLAAKVGFGIQPVGHDPAEIAGGMAQVHAMPDSVVGFEKRFAAMAPFAAGAIAKRFLERAELFLLD